MADKGKKKRGLGTSWLAWLALLVVALLFLRALGPGGLRMDELLAWRPGAKVDDAPPAPSPPPPPSPPPEAPGTGPVADAPPPPPGITGRILTADGKPATGATVEAVFEAGRETGPRVVMAHPTDAEGAFRMDMPEGPFRNFVLRASRGPLSASFDLGEATGPGWTVTLRLPASFTVGGLVLAAEDGRPLDGILVRFGERETTTARGGRFTLKDLPAALLEGDLPPVVLTGAGRRSLERALPASGGFDDLLLRMDPE